MIRNRFALACLFALVLMLWSCDSLTPFAETPTYIQIDSFILADNPNVDEGSLSHDIVDAWVFIDDEMIGIFELPATIPVLETGSHKLTIGPGILNSTISSSRENYPFYTAYTDLDFELTPGETYNVKPISTYRDDEPNYTYSLIEDFESSIVAVDSFGSSEVPLEVTEVESLVFEGDGSGVMNLTANTGTARFKTPSYFFPSGSKRSFMELNYYSDFHFTVGVAVNNNVLQNEVIDYLTLTPTTDDGNEKSWKKAYIDLSTITNDSPNAIDYYVYFDVLVGNETDRKEGKVMVDNIKFIHQR